MAIDCKRGQGTPWSVAPAEEKEEEENRYRV
jgi:hypothetical protein